MTARAGGEFLPEVYRVADVYALSEGPARVLPEVIRRLQDGTAAAPRDRGPQHGTGDGVMIVVRPMADGAGDGTYADAKVQVRDATTGVYADGVETVSFRPFWVGMKQKTGPLWRCEDTGTVTAGSPPKRRLEGVIPPMIARQVMVNWGCTGGTPANSYATIWVPDVLP